MFTVSNLSGAGLNNTDPEQERDPPAAATPVTFPQPQAYSTTVWSKESPPPPLQPLFSRILKPTDVTDDHIKAVNVQIARASSADHLLPLAPDGSSYFPPLTLDQESNTASYADAAKVDGEAARKRKAYDDRFVELRIDNDAAYRVINRTTKPGVRPPRLAHFRKFWEGLETMSAYWDTTLDQYYEGPPPPPAAAETMDKGVKRPRLDPTQLHNIDIPIPDSASGTGASTEDMKLNNTQEIASQTPLPDDRTSRATSVTPEPRTCLRYKGRRTASGCDMPDQFRTDTVKAFMEGVVWAFQCSIAPPRQMPIVQVNKLNLPVRQSAAVYRLPRDRAKARSGCLIGPIMTIQVRPETDFQSHAMTESQRKAKARLDMIREIGGLFQCAQERNRQGKKETQPGQGKWWTEKPRWGGGRGGESDNEDGNGDVPVKDVLQMAEEMVGARERSAKPRRQQKKTPAMLWRELKCGSKIWDSRTEYEAVGKHPASDYDEIFMVSSLNHHISIIKLTIHTAYTEYIRTERSPEPPLDDPKWCSPTLERTEWFDLFDVDDRVQAFRALWGIMSYLTREVAGGESPAVNGNDRKSTRSEPGTRLSTMITSLFAAQ